MIYDGNLTIYQNFLQHCTKTLDTIRATPPIYEYYLPWAAEYHKILKFQEFRRANKFSFIVF